MRKAWRRRDGKREREIKRERKLLRLVLLHEGCGDLAGGGETEIISSDRSTWPLPLTLAHKLFPVTACPQACPKDTVTDRTTHH